MYCLGNPYSPASKRGHPLPVQQNISQSSLPSTPPSPVRQYKTPPQPKPSSSSSKLSSQPAKSEPTVAEQSENVVKSSYVEQVSPVTTSSALPLSRAISRFFRRLIGVFYLS
jgi:hypothetical protein